MRDPFSRESGPEFEIEPTQKLLGTVKGLFVADGSAPTGFVTAPVDKLNLGYEGIPGDVHAGLTRKSGAREPWYPRGTEMRNERQLSILSTEELRLIARRLDIPELKAEWIGGNLLLDGIPSLSMLPPRSLLFFAGGVTIRIDGDNGPCRLSGKSIASQFSGRQDIELNFARQAQHLRGLVGWVEKIGSIEVGESFEVRVFPQWIYKAT